VLSGHHKEGFVAWGATLARRCYLALPGLQGAFKVTAERTTESKDRYKMEAFILLFMTLWTFVDPKEESVLFSKSNSKYLLYNENTVSFFCHISLWCIA
jgi:hypothetical protein